MALLSNVMLLVLGCFVIYYCSNKLGDSIDLLGKKMKLPSSIKGATLNGISSSTPEFLTSLIAAFMVIGIIGEPDVTAFADVSIGTLSGSAIFNILVIPFTSLVFIPKDKLKEISIDKKGMMRDVLFYTMSLLVLFGSIFLFGKIGFLTGLVMVLLYIAYVFVLVLNVKASKEIFEEVKESYLLMFSKMIMWLIPIGIAVHFCVNSAEFLGSTWNIPRLIMSLVVLAGVTSVPDLILSVRDAIKGDLDSSIANVIGSNIFDILICLGFVLMITKINIVVIFSEVSFIFILLLVSALFYTVAFYFNFSKNIKLVLLAIPYICFILYIVLQCM